MGQEQQCRKSRRPSDATEKILKISGTPRQKARQALCLLLQTNQAPTEAYDQLTETNRAVISRDASDADRFVLPHAARPTALETP
eukprot:s635_g11.t1